jgi:hypothetical protein
MKYLMIGLFVISSGCAGTDLGGLEIDTGRGDSIKWSLPDENCMQIGELKTRSGLIVKRTQKAKDCIVKDSGVEEKV